VEDVLTGESGHLVKGQAELISRIIQTEAEIRVRSHAEWLSRCRDPDTHFIRLIQTYAPRPSGTPTQITDMLKRVCRVVSREHRLFDCDIVGVGSHHDGTKMFRFDEMDFVVLLKYRVGVDYRANYRIEALAGEPAVYDILPVIGTDLHRLCEEGDLLDDGRLNVKRYKAQLIDVLKSAIPRVCRRLGLRFGGWNRPGFRGFEENGPANTFVVDGISVDLTPAFRAKTDKRMKIYERKINRRQSSGQGRDRRAVNYAGKGLLVLSRDHCEISLSEIETHLFRSVPELQSALQVCKVYRSVMFDLPWPNLGLFYRHLEGRVQEWIMDMLKTDADQGADTVYRVLGIEADSTDIEDTDTESTQTENTSTEDTDTESTGTEDTDTESTETEDTNTESTETEDTNTESTDTEDTDTESTDTEDTDTESTDTEDTDTESTDTENTRTDGTDTDRGDAVALVVLATKARPLTLDGRILKKLQQIHQKCGNRIKDGVYPSLLELLDEEKKPVVKTMSFVFKCLTLEEWLKSDSATSTTIIINVIRTFEQKLKSYDHLILNVRHPLSDILVSVVKLHRLSLTPHTLLKINATHQRNVKQITSQVVILVFVHDNGVVFT